MHGIFCNFVMNNRPKTIEHPIHFIPQIAHQKHSAENKVFYQFMLKNELTGPSPYWNCKRNWKFWYEHLSLTSYLDFLVKFTLCYHTGHHSETMVRNYAHSKVWTPNVKFNIKLEKMNCNAYSFFMHNSRTTWQNEVVSFNRIFESS